jgi:hypothetical protein
MLGSKTFVGAHLGPVTTRPTKLVASARALSLSYTHDGYSDGSELIERSQDSINADNLPNVLGGVSKRVDDMGSSSMMRQGESCEWPRACAWPMKESRIPSEIAQDAMADAAAAAALSNSIEWTPEAKVYTMNEQVDPFLPPDVELLAFFSDSPIAWRAHEEYSEDSDDDIEQEGRGKGWKSAVVKWWSKMWRYQGLGL